MIPHTTPDMKNKIVLSTLFLAIFFFFLFLLRSPEDYWICADTGWFMHGKPSLNKPTMPCGKIETQLAVEKYLKDNISNISPKKEVLGGKFYVNKIDWVGNNSGMVEYEDGHILLNASFDYIVQNDIKNDSYLVMIDNFNIIQ